MFVCLCSRKINFMEKKIAEEQAKSEQVKRAMVAWRQGMMSSYFYHWLDKAKFIAKKKKTMATFLARWKGEVPQTYEICFLQPGHNPLPSGQRVGGTVESDAEGRALAKSSSQRFCEYCFTTGDGETPLLGF